MRSSNTKKKIVLTGGGTAGHVMPHVAILDHLKSSGFEVHYIGSNGVEQSIIAPLGVPFHQIQSGKLRRYFSWDNFLDVFKIFVGFIQAFRLLKEIRPNIVFSKGGYVSVPVAVAAWLLRIPVVSHESDYSPGLANRIIERFAAHILFAFPETRKFLKKPGQLVGIPVRPELFNGSKEKGYLRCGFLGREEFPTILIMGGSLGSIRINQVVIEVLPKLLEKYNVIHIAGKGKCSSQSFDGYFQSEFISAGLEDLLALADVVVARAGANSIFEFLQLKKSMILIPLEAGSRGDQIQNARCFKEHHWARVIREKDLTGETLLAEVEDSLRQEFTQISDENHIPTDSSMSVIRYLEAAAKY